MICNLFVMMGQLCHSNDFGSLQLCSPFAIRVLALLFAFQLVRTQDYDLSRGAYSSSKFSSLERTENLTGLH
jgi:hypothetical protein